MRNPIIVALDLPTTEQAIALAEQVAPAVGAFKIGKELFTAVGPDIVRRIRATGAQLLNQSVLLAGVNDDETSLVDLSTALFRAGALPYYLHLLDRVRGASHFDVPEARGRELLRAIHARLPGYLVPRLVREEAGAAGKTPLAA